jgi:hypothetical protein
MGNRSPWISGLPVGRRQGWPPQPAPSGYNPAMEQTHYHFADCAGRLTDVRDYAAERDGAAHCPGCGGALVAVRGERRGWHFRHHGSGGCDPAAYEAACAALEARGRRRARERSGAGGGQPEGHAGSSLLEHPLVIAVGVFAAVAFVLLAGEARKG